MKQYVDRPSGEPVGLDAGVTAACEVEPPLHDRGVKKYSWTKASTFSVATRIFEITLRARGRLVHDRIKWAVKRLRIHGLLLLDWLIN